MGEIDPYRTEAEGIRKQIDELMDMIGDKQYLNSQETTLAREKMRKLKEDLGAYSERYKRARGAEPVSTAESRFLQAMHEAIIQLSARWNSDPINSRWFGLLYACRIDVDHYLSGLQTTRR